MTDTAESTRRMSRPLGTSVIYSVHELVQQAKLHRQQTQPAVTHGKWQMGDPRHGTTTTGKFRDRCGAIVNSSICQTACKWLLYEMDQEISRRKSYDLLMQHPILSLSLQRQQF